MVAPVNDAFADRIPLVRAFGTAFPEGPRLTWYFTDVLSIEDATLESSEPVATANVERSMWFAWTCPAAFDGVETHMRVAESGSDFNPILGVYTGTGFGDMTLVVASDAEFGGAANCFWTPTGGVTYLIQVGAPSTSISAWTFRLFFDDPGGGWPLHVVDSDGTVYRVGPSSNPDGGVLRLVEADGTRWVQDAAGTRPLAVVDSDGTVLTTLPMSLDTP